MAGEFLADYILDLALAELDVNATHLYICSQVPTTFAEATSTYALGVKASPSIGAPADRAPSGRKVTLAAIADGLVTATGTASHWALTKTTGSTLMATGPLSPSTGVTSGNTFTTNAIDIGIPDAVVT
jgi:hypothetical protein